MNELNYFLCYCVVIALIVVIGFVVLYWIDYKRAKDKVELIERLMKDPKFKDAWCENAVREVEGKE